MLLGDNEDENGFRGPGFAELKAARFGQAA